MSKKGISLRFTAPSACGQWVTIGYATIFLFMAKLSQRMRSDACVQDANLIVLTEGEATRSLNFDSGL